MRLTCMNVKRLVRRESMTSYPQSTLSALAGAGIDPSTTLEDGATTEGYYSVQFDEDGRLMYDKNYEIVSKWVKWPALHRNKIVEALERDYIMEEVE